MKNFDENMRRIRKIRRLCGPTPLETLEGRLAEIASVANGDDDSSESDSDIRMRLQGLGKRKAPKGRDRKERGGRDRSLEAEVTEEPTGEE